MARTALSLKSPFSSASTAYTSALFALTLAIGGSACGDSSGGDGSSGVGGFDGGNLDSTGSDTSGDSGGLDGVDTLDPIDSEGEGNGSGGDGQGTTGGDGIDPDNRPLNPERCRALDLVFVIDNSGSMADEQRYLVGAFPGFIRDLRQLNAEITSYHIGVLATDGDGELVPRPVDNPINGCDELAAEGPRYLTEEDDLEKFFKCFATLGTMGDSNERPMDALVNVLSPELNGEGGVNEGFLRDDALMVVALITDEEDNYEDRLCGSNINPPNGSKGDPDSWFQAVSDARGGQENVVVMSLIGPTEDNEELEKCPPLPIGPEREDCDTSGDKLKGAEEAPRLEEFTKKFSNRAMGRVCEPGYRDYFNAVLEKIESACAKFNPPE